MSSCYMSSSCTHPLPDSRAPPHDAALQPWVWSNPRPLQHGATFYPDAILYNYVGADGYIGSDGAVFPDLGSWVLQGKKKTDRRQKMRSNLNGNSLHWQRFQREEELHPPRERCRENRVQCEASQELVVVATEGTYTSLSGSLWADRCPSRTLQTDNKPLRQGCGHGTWRVLCVLHLFTLEPNRHKGYNTTR